MSHLSETYSLKIQNNHNHLAFCYPVQDDQHFSFLSSRKLSLTMYQQPLLYHHPCDNYRIGSVFRRFIQYHQLPSLFGPYLVMNW